MINETSTFIIKKKKKVIGRLQLKEPIEIPPSGKSTYLSTLILQVWTQKKKNYKEKVFLWIHQFEYEWPI